MRHVLDASPEPLGPPASSRAVARRFQTFSWEHLCWLIALGLAFIQAWGRRHESADGLAYMGPDGISYLDIGDAYMRGDWYVAVNAMWSPFYSWLLGLTLHLIKPSPFWEFTVVRLLNLLIFIFTLICFAYFLRALRGMQDRLQTHGALPEWSWLVFGYSIFIWTSLFMNRVSRTSPDLLLSALIFLSCGLLVRIGREPARWHLFVALGVSLGIGYLTKTIMFPLAFIFAAVALVVARRNLGTRAALLHVSVSLIIFLTLALPLVIVLSAAKQRLTIGESARLNYAWYVNGTTRFIHWQGEPPGSGTPLHSTRKIFDQPAVYEFGGLAGVSYPPWYDPSYWYEGATPHFTLRQQLTAIRRNLAALYALLLTRFFLPTIAFALFVLLYQTGGRRIVWRNLLAYWFLLVPSLSAVGLYLFINIEARYLAPFIAVISLSCFAAVQLSTTGMRRLIAATSFGLVIAFVLSVLPQTARATYSAARTFSSSRAASRDIQWQVANELQKHGVREMDRVAAVGNTMYAAWPRLARVRVVAEIPELPVDEAQKFWTADQKTRTQALTAIAHTGARVLVAEDAPRWATAEGWQRLGSTNYFIYPLQ